MCDEGWLKSQSSVSEMLGQEYYVVHNSNVRK